MSRLYFTNIDLQNNELRSAVIVNLSAPPSSPKTGQLYYSTTLSALYIWNGTAWVPSDASKSAAGSIPLAALNNLQGTVQSYPLSAFAPPLTNIPMGGYTFTGLPTPIAAGQAAEYAWVVSQVQSALAGISSKDPVAAVALANVAALSGTQTIDAVALAVGNRVLLTAQTTASQNGVWVVQIGAWTRPVVEGSTTAELDTGAMWLATQGTVGAGTQWRLATTGTITPGTTPISILQFGAGNSYTAGNGISLIGSAFSVNPAAGGNLTVSASGVSVTPGAFTRKVSATIGDGSSTSYTVTHSLGTQDVQVQVYQTSAPFGTVEVDVNRTDTNNVAVVFTVAPASNAYRVVVIG